MASVSTGKIDVNEAVENGRYPFFTCSREAYCIDEAPYEGKAVLVAGNGDLNVKYYEGRFNAYQRTYFLFSRNEEILEPRFLYYFLKSHLATLRAGASGSTIKYIKVGDLKDAQIPLPPLDEQHRIVAKLDEAFAEINELQESAKLRDFQNQSLRVVALGKLVADARLIAPERTLGSFLEIARGGSPRPIKSFLTDDPDGINWIKIGDATASTKYIYKTEQRITADGVSRSRMVHDGDFLLSNSMSFGRPYIMRTDGCIHDGWLVLKQLKEEFDPDYLYFALSSDYVFHQFDSRAAGSTVRNLNIGLVSSVSIPFPDIETQRKLAERMVEVDSAFGSLGDIEVKRASQLERLRTSVLSATLSTVR